MKINTIEEAEYDKENLWSIISWIQIAGADMTFEYHELVFESPTSPSEIYQSQQAV